MTLWGEPDRAQVMTLWGEPDRAQVMTLWGEPDRAQVMTLWGEPDRAQVMTLWGEPDREHNLEHCNHIFTSTSYHIPSISSTHCNSQLTGNSQLIGPAGTYTSTFLA